MRRVLNFVIIASVVLVFNMACSKKEQRRDPTVLNTEDLILLDAENLAEGGINTLYKKDVLPKLQNYVSSAAIIEEEYDPQDQSYKVASQGKTYLIDSPGMNLAEGQLWGNAGFALFDIVNRQLQNSPYRFYAVYGGNDLSGIFLTREGYEQAIRSVTQKIDWPYLPDSTPPWYGQPHD
jgi:hypothetical protein